MGFHCFSIQCIVYFQIHIFCFGEEIKGSPVSLKVTSLPTPPSSLVHGGRLGLVYNNNNNNNNNTNITMPQPQNEFESREIGKVSFSGLSEPCAVGSIVEVVVRNCCLRKVLLHCYYLCVWRNSPSFVLVQFQFRFRVRESDVCRDHDKSLRENPVLCYVVYFIV